MPDSDPIIRALHAAWCSAVDRQAGFERALATARAHAQSGKATEKTARRAYLIGSLQHGAAVESLPWKALNVRASTSRGAYCCRAGSRVEEAIVEAMVIAMSQKRPVAIWFNQVHLDVLPDSNAGDLLALYLAKRPNS